MEIFDKHMPGPNQYYKRPENVSVTAKALSDPKVPGSITEQGIRDNISAALSYCAAWISGNGCVPINNLMVSSGERKTRSGRRRGGSGGDASFRVNPREVGPYLRVFRVRSRVVTQAL